MGPAERSEQEKSLLRALGQQFVDAEPQSLFPPDPEFEATFRREFDEVDDFSGDLAAVWIGEKLGYIDREGTMVWFPRD